MVTRPPDPPVPSASLPLESSVSGGPPRLSVLPAPSAPRRGPPWRPPSLRGRISLFTLSANQLPFLGARGHKTGSGQGGRRDKKGCWGMAKAWGGQGRGGGWGLPGSRGRRGPSLGPGQGPRLQHSVLVHDLLHQLLFLTAQGVQLVPGKMAGGGVGGAERRCEQSSGFSRCTLLHLCTATPLLVLHTQTRCHVG